MGCDIHTIAQIKKNNKWITVKIEIAETEDFGGRCYHSFAILANVRNEQGVGGDITGGKWVPIAKPRGLPCDLIPDMSSKHNIKLPEGNFFLGEHSYSWLLAAEIAYYLDYELPKHYFVSGLVTAETFLKLAIDGIEPDSGFSHVSGPGIKIIDGNEIYDMLSDHFRITTKRVATKTTKHVKYFIKTIWKVEAKTRIKYLLNVAEELKQIAKDENVPSQSVRLVFGFDS